VHVDVMTSPLPLAAAGDLARSVQQAGIDGLVVTETSRSAYLTCGAAAVAAPGLDLLTGIAVAFPRSPMVTAAEAWELAEASDGHFRLGLGTQVKAHVERRYSSEFAPPGPRLKEYVQAVRACFRAFAGEEKLDFQGRWWQMNLLPGQWAPGKITQPAPAIDIAAVNPWMLRMAGEVADGVHVHPLNSPTYLRETALPNIGDTDEERARWREMARMQVSFYGSTPNYAFIFEQLGHEGTTERVREKQKAGDIGGMAACIDDDLLSHFVVDSDWDGAAAAISSRYRGIAARVVLYFGAMDRDNLGRWGEVARRLA
jgi:alkanesulfonate monooxygenase SsuD/methylene tetrahydromethanopterin reductase-like flavin-dependent oxidoreductase (luciferase family)